MSGEQPGRASDVTISPARDLPEGDGRSDARGHMHRFKGLMADDDARAFLRSQKVAHVGTVDERGWPYVVPLIYIYEGGDRLYVHTEIMTGTSSGTSSRILERVSKWRKWDPYTVGTPSPAIQRSSTRA